MPATQVHLTGREYWEISECLMLVRRTDPALWARTPFLEYNLVSITTRAPQLVKDPEATQPWNLSKDEAEMWLYLLSLPSDGELQSNPSVRPGLQSKLAGALAAMD